MTPRLQTEITMELLSDLAAAIRAVMSNTVPSLRLKVQVIGSPNPGILVTVESDQQAIYPRFVEARAVLQPSAEYRRRFGLQRLEEYV